MRKFLRSPHGAHVVACFWDFASLPQKPRSEAEDALFKTALSVMGDMYASTLGTMVIRHRALPTRPATLDGETVVIGYKPADTADADVAAELRHILKAHGAIKSLYCDDQGRWRVCFTSHAEAEAAVALGLGERGTIFCYYTSRPYDERGWPNFESAVSTEMSTRAQYYPKLKAALAALPPKLVEIDCEDGPLPLSEYGDGDTDMNGRVERIRTAIANAFFTGKGDKETVLDLYSEYFNNIMTLMNLSGSGADALDYVYEGDYNAAGEREGQGVLRFKLGDVYQGEWKADQLNGRGTEHIAGGDVYEGEFKNTARDGHGTVRSVNGFVYSSEWKRGLRSGHGVARDRRGCRYVGQWKANKMEGHGTMWRAEGVYEGEWRADTENGLGIFRYANGDIYEGNMKDGRWDGPGTLWLANGIVEELGRRTGRHERSITVYYRDGTAYVGLLKFDENDGEGVRWSADRQQAVRMLNGFTQQGEISLEEAQHIIVRRQLQMPSHEPPSRNGLRDWWFSISRCWGPEGHPCMCMGVALAPVRGWLGATIPSGSGCLRFMARGGER